jgi:hypothetical protein
MRRSGAEAEAEVDTISIFGAFCNVWNAACGEKFAQRYGSSTFLQQPAMAVAASARRTETLEAALRTRAPPSAQTYSALGDTPTDRFIRHTNSEFTHQNNAQTEKEYREWITSPLRTKPGFM